MDKVENKRILIIGDGNHYFNRKLVERLKKEKSTLQIDCYSLNPIDFRLDLPYDNIFDGTIKTPKFLDIKGGRQLYYLYLNKLRRHVLQEYINKYQYEHIHIHFARYCIYPWIKNFTGKVIITIWGSDFYRASKVAQNLLKPLYNKANLITFPTEVMAKDFSFVFSQSTKHRIVKFGLEAFEYIDQYRETKLRNDKLNVTIGYNRTTAQQHILILQELKKLDNTLLNKIKITIPFTYGPKDDAYRAKIESMLQKLSIEYTFIDEFLDDIAIAKLRLKSDIMIQLQTTDSFSGSMQEYMYAGNVIITGSWLPYIELKEKDLYFETIDELGSLSKKITYVIQQYDNLHSKCIKNIGKLKNISSWEVNIKKWLELYD